MLFTLFITDLITAKISTKMSVTVRTYQALLLVFNTAIFMFGGLLAVAYALVVSKLHQSFAQCAIRTLNILSYCSYLPFAVTVVLLMPGLIAMYAAISGSISAIKTRALGLVSYICLVLSLAIMQIGAQYANATATHNADVLSVLGDVSWASKTNDARNAYQLNHQCCGYASTTDR